ncbi:penicillin-binding protein 2 [Candidatus Uhrbacteria bacterium]|nr:penicillin-binding protein 2 [Candidatus Uhrbacteria bacterium]
MFGRHPVFGLQSPVETPPFQGSDSASPAPFIGAGEDRMSDALENPIAASARQIGGWAFFLLGLMLVGRVLWLQLGSTDQFVGLAARNRQRIERTPAVRGLITDRNGVPLAVNIPSFTLSIVGAQLPKQVGPRDEMLGTLSEWSRIPLPELDIAMRESLRWPSVPILVQKGIPYDAALRLLSQADAFPGVEVLYEDRRSYPFTSRSLSHVIGYVGRMSPEDLMDAPAQTYAQTDEIGKAGAESAFESVLHGVPGMARLEVDARGHEQTVLEQRLSVPGGNVRLAIDAELTTLIESSMQTVFQKSATSAGAAIVLDANTGAVRALVSLPAYDNNAFVGGVDPLIYKRFLEDKTLPLFPRALAGEYPPGSVFKPTVAYAALKEGIIDEHASVVSSGGISVASSFFPDWKRGGHGATDVRKALAESVNTFFYIVGGGLDPLTGLGVDRITQYARQFGYGTPTGIELPGEADGFLPSKEWKQSAKGERWYVGDTYHLSIGQGDILVTPLQLAAATAMVANGGRPVRPTLVEAVEGQAWDRSSEAVGFGREMLDPSYAKVVSEGMRQTVTKGTAKSLADLPIGVAGKTGTAQTPTEGKTHAWFAGFAPYDHPQIAVVVLIEYAGEGSTWATPIARDIFRWWAARGGVETPP